VPPNCMGLLCRHPHPGRPWAECRIVDDDGRDVTVGETGELAVRTPILMQGYFNDEEQTRKSFRDGWFLTGDLVRADAQGRYYFVSRKKDIIRRRGENVAGSELDRVIGEHPGVLVAAAIGVHSEFGDEDILVAVKPKEGLALTEQDVVDWCRQRLTAMKVPRYVILLDDMPLTPTHKVAKAELRKDPTLRQRAVDFNA
jgi:carnitine-CoA ligase